MKRDLKKNQISMYYALYSTNIPVLDADGNDTLETMSGYKKPIQFSASISFGRSDASDSPFGNNVSYDRVILSSDMSLPVTDTSLIWIDNAPTYDEAGTVKPDSADYKVAALPLKSLNTVKIAVRRNVVNT